MKEHHHFVCIGAGIMSATLAAFFQELMPEKDLLILERLKGAAEESTSAWNNAGTGHAANCELNYTPENANGKINIDKALKIHAQFEESKQFWAYLLKNRHISKPQDFINDLPQMSFVSGDKNVKFLKARYQEMVTHPFFKEMNYSEDFDTISSWVPLMMRGRSRDYSKMAMTKMDEGTDVNFENITKQIIAYLKESSLVQVRFENEVQNIEKNDKGSWNLEIEDLKKDTKYEISADFVFIGAGGGALHLLEKSDIEEAEGYGGFPVSGQWLVCKNESIINQHFAKVYGMAELGAPPMSVPHLDTRIIEGQRNLFFGPFAGFSTKFLKNGSYFDLITSIERDNIWPMISAGWHNRDLTKYLIEQVSLSFEERMDMLRKFYPEAKDEDWEMKIAGQRVQVIKRDESEGGKLEFGTEIIANAEHSLAALLGASPGASTAVSIMLGILEKCFPEEYNGIWQEKLKEIIPYRAKDLISNPKNISKSKTLCKDLF